jgi:hypothetical protein
MDDFYLPRLPAPVRLRDIYQYASETTHRGSVRTIDDQVVFFIENE